VTCRWERFALRSDDLRQVNGGVTEFTSDVEYRLAHRESRPPPGVQCVTSKHDAAGPEVRYHRRAFPGRSFGRDSLVYPLSGLPADPLPTSFSSQTGHRECGKIPEAIGSWPHQMGIRWTLRTPPQTASPGVGASLSGAMVVLYMAAERRPSAVTHLRWVPRALAWRCEVRTKYASHLAGYPSEGSVRRLASGPF
jgi:hypothetical protein